MTGPERSVGACADRSTWQSLLEERVDEALRPALLVHLNACPDCAETLANIASQWSLAELTAVQPPEGPITQGILQRIAGPDALPPPPAIPGIDGLVFAGRGGMGAVYRGRDTRLSRPVAVKVLASGISTSARARLAREARVLASLDHPHIVKIHSAGEAEGLPYLVMEWIEGRTLEQRIAENVLEPRAAAAIALALTQALATVHAVGIVHRDLKPDNVLLQAANARGHAAAGEAVPKLVDFGLARPDDADAGLTRTTAVLGTPAFMAPEQTGLEPALGAITSATDIHGVGAMLFAMLTGRPPYDAPTAGESLRRAAHAEAMPLETLTPATPLDLRTIVATCLRYEPVSRYRSAADLAADLTRFLEGRPIHARPAGVVSRLRSWQRRRPAVAAAAVVAAVLATAGLAGFVFHVTSLGAARAAAASSQDAARTARDHAREALARLTDDTIEAMLLRGPALGERDRNYLLSIRDQYRRWPLEPDAAAGLAFRAEGLDRVARLFNRVERPDDALECVVPLLETLAALERLTPGAADVRTRRLAALDQERHYLFQVGRFEESRASARRAIAEMERMAATDHSVQVPLATALLDLAYGLAPSEPPEGQAAGDDDEVTMLAARALDLLRTAASVKPDDPQRLEAEVKALYNAALVSARQGRLDERQERFALLVDRCRFGLDAFPREDVTWRRGLLLGLTSLAGFELESGRPEAALATALERSAAAATACEAHPDETVFVGEMIHAAAQVFAYRDAVGRGADSRADLAAAVRLAERALEREPAVYDRSRLLGLALEKQAHLLEQEGEIAAAVAARDRLATVLTPWQDQEPVAIRIAEQCGASARLLAAAGDPKAAIDRLDRAIAACPSGMRPAFEAERSEMLAPAGIAPAQTGR